MGKLLTYLAVYSLIYAFYVVFTGATSLFSLILGALASLVVSLAAKPLLISRNIELKDLKKVLYIVTYYIYYMTVAEVKAHINIARIVLGRRVNISPAIVEIPYYVKSDYGMTLIAGSITNTPGTLVVQVDTTRKAFYVHWIKALTHEPLKAREHVSKVFEEYALKIFG